MSETLELRTLRLMNDDYLSKSRLKRIVGEDVDAALIVLLEKGLIEGISVSSTDKDHFKLTKSGEDLLEAERRQSKSLQSSRKEKSDRAPRRVMPSNRNSGL